MPESEKRHPADFAARWSEFDEDADFDRVDAPPPNDPAENVARNEDLAFLRLAIDELPHDLKSALLLFALEGHSQEEAASLLGCSAKAVETRVYRARKRLRQRLQQLQGN